MKDLALANIGKFQDPDVTAKGEARAKVSLTHPETLWFNTGTLCNIACTNCYIESSPTNDALVYISADEVSNYLDQLDARQWDVREIAFTGGEPFMAPEMIDMMEAALSRGHQVLVLTNAMQPMMRPRVQKGPTDLQARFGDQITMRISLDHYAKHNHDEERGAGSYDLTLKGMKWLRDKGFNMAIAGRTMWGESEEDERQGYRNFISEHGFSVDADNPSELVLFPEMEESDDPPEITTACWGILNKDPREIMCASQRMVVKRKGADSPSVLACTLIPYDERFEIGKTLKEAREPVSLNHPFCASFCVLGGGSCSA